VYVFTVERLHDVGGGGYRIGTAENEDRLRELLADRHGSFMIRHGDKRVRWELTPVYGGPLLDEYREWYRAQLGEIVKALTDADRAA